MREDITIQWFPGHMAKARRLIAEQLKMVDAVCEVIDARIPLSSRNPDISEIAGKKPILVVINRTDQADPDATAAWRSLITKQGFKVLLADSKSGKGTAHFSAVLRGMMADKLALWATKGQSGRQLRTMVVGIPNVGKSSFINRIAGRRAAAAADKPGVTRGKQWVSIDSGLELLDTPGILWPKFGDPIIAENLAFTGAIRDGALDIETLGANFMLRMNEYYPERIFQRYGVKIKAESDGYALLAQAAKNRGFLVSGGQVDIEKMAVIALDEFRGGKLGRITLELPGAANEPAAAHEPVKANDLS